VGTSPEAINDNGDVTGRYSQANGTQNVFVRHVDGTFTTSILPPGTVLTFAFSINNSGFVCGYGEGQHSAQGGFLFDPSGNLIIYSGPQPNTRGSCQSINDNLHATGNYRDNSTGKMRGWVK
jgi:hypothetical protein